MWLALLIYQLATLPLTHENVCLSHTTFRKPDNADMDVNCGTKSVELKMLLCPVYFVGYNESLMAFNAQYTKDACRGIPDWTVDPPVLKFNFSINEESITTCANKMKVTQEVGTGIFSDFSNVQFINISGVINSCDPHTGTITYRQEMLYKFSCRYPLQYVVNKTEMSISGVSLAMKDSSGTFISTLSMQLYSDRDYQSALRFPDKGLQLKTRIFVQVKATNLTTRFNVLLDRCFATTTLNPVNSTYYDLFVGCNKDGQTVIDVNGLQQAARFSFEAFRFVQHKNRTLSTFYLHCTTRLCERSTCTTLVQNCNNRRRRRAIEDSQGTSVSDEATVSSGPITTRVDNEYPEETEVAQLTHRKGTVFGVAIAAGVVGALCITLVAFILYQAFKSKGILSKTVLYLEG